MRTVSYTHLGSLDTEISDIIYDSRKAAPGLLFVCIVGTQRDSHEFAADLSLIHISGPERLILKIRGRGNGSHPQTT